MADAFDLSCHLKSIDIKGDMDVLDSTALCSTTKTYTAGLVEHSISGEGFFAYNATDDTLSVDRHFNDETGASAGRFISVGIQGGTAGSEATLMHTKQASYSVNSVVGELIMTSFEAKATDEGSSDDFASNGVWLLYQSVTGTVNGTTVDDGAGATTGWLAHAHVTADNFTSMVIKVQHSTDGTTWADLITFTTFTTVGVEQAVNTATSVNRYIRAIVSSFTGTSASVGVCIKTGYSG